MLITTTPAIEGRPVRHVLGLVHGETILGANLFRDLLASLREIVGGRARAYEAALIRAREMALEELEHRARLLGQAGGMLMVCATGTAVELMPPQTLPPPPPPLPPDHGCPTAPPCPVGPAGVGDTIDTLDLSFLAAVTEGLDTALSPPLADVPSTPVD